MSELRCIAQQVIKYLHYITIITVYDQLVTGRFKNELYARIESGESDTLTAALYPTEGWEGDVLGNRYLPAQSARGILTFQDGRISWKAG